MTEREDFEAEVEDLQEQNRDRINAIEQEFHGLLHTLHTALVKMRLDVTIDFFNEVLTSIGVENADVAFAMKWEAAYSQFLDHLATEARKAKLTEGVHP